jgi:hypothetical protein
LNAPAVTGALFQFVCDRQFGADFRSDGRYYNTDLDDCAPQDVVRLIAWGGTYRTGRSNYTYARWLAFA